MAVTNAQAAPKSAPGEKVTTTLDSDVTKPGVVAPGDAPYDTLDATEIATSVSPDKGSAAAAGFGVVNAVQKLDRIPGSLSPAEVAKWNGTTSDGGERTEKYDVIGPDGKVVSVTHNIDTGETSVG